MGCVTRKPGDGRREQRGIAVDGPAPSRPRRDCHDKDAADERAADLPRAVAKQLIKVSTPILRL